MRQSLAISEELVLDALREIVDPCSIGVGRPVDIVELGIVDGVKILETSITVRLLLTDPACFFFRDLSRYIKDTLQGRFETEDVHIELVSDKFWTPKLTPLSRGTSGS